MKIDKSGKSLAFFLVNQIKTVSENKIQKIKNLSKKIKNDVRICLHDNKKKGCQIMIIAKYKNKKDKLNYFSQNKKKLFFLMDGKLILNYKKRNITLSKKIPLYYHHCKRSLSSYSLTTISVYMEIIF